MDAKLDDFDWVTERLGCSGFGMYERLFAMAKKAVVSRNGAAVDGRLQERFHCHEVSSDGRRGFSVWDGWTRGRNSGHAVEVWLEGDYLTFMGVGGNDIEARAILDENGDCRFVVDEKPLEPWQMMRFLLEPLLFREQS